MREDDRTSEITTLTLGDAMRGAFQAILRGNTAERDQLVAMAERAFVEHGATELPSDTDLLARKGHQQ